MNRRDFFKIVTVSGAAAATGGCQQASETILPLVVPNEQIVPGVASWFATVCRECPAGCGVLAKNREGRIVKLEGNPDHPVNAGALCLRGQAALQGLYHPDRIAGPLVRDGSGAFKAGTWDAATKLVAERIGALRTAGKGRALAVLRVMVDEGMADRRFAEAVARVDLKRAADQSGVPVETIKHVATVFAHAKPGLAVGGGVAVTGSNATETQIAINLLNAAAGNVGKTVRFGADSAYGKVTPHSEVAALARAMAAGEVELLLIGPGVDPAFTLPSGLKFADALRKVGLVVSFSNLPDQTTELAHVSLPDTHWLESWGDYSPREGVLGFLQPTMAPIRDSRPMGDTLLRIGRAALGAEEGKGPLPWSTFEQYLKAAWEPLVKGQLETTLRRGGVFGDVAPVAVTAKIAAVEMAPAKLEGDAGGLTLLAYPSLRFYDGRSAASSWLQEAPDSMTQAVWDAWVEVPAETARKLGVVQGDMLAVKSPHGSLELPAYISPTLHPSAVAIPMGHRYAPYQRPRYVAADPRSLNPMDILPAAADPTSGGLAFMSVKVTLTKLGTRRPLAVLQATQDQDDRELAQHVDLRAARAQAVPGRRPNVAVPP